MPLAELRDPSIVAVRAYRLIDGRIDGEGSLATLDGPIARGDEQWTAPEGSWYVSILFTQPQPFGAMNPLYGQKVIEHYFEPFEHHSAGAMGDVVTNFFQDELTFGGSMPYWCERLPEEFRHRKGYDPTPERPRYSPTWGRGRKKSASTITTSRWCRWKRPISSRFSSGASRRRRVRPRSMFAGRPGQRRDALRRLLSDAAVVSGSRDRPDARTDPRQGLRVDRPALRPAAGMAGEAITARDGVFGRKTSETGTGRP